MPEPGRPAVVLLSGGLDSTTVLAIATREARQRVHALSFAYGQRHTHELRYAKLQASNFGVVAHEIIELPSLGRIVSTSSSLVASSELTVPSAAAREGHDDIPTTYVPARNTVFLSYALAWAEVLGARDIWIGVNAVDYSGYPDCRPEFVAAFEGMARVAIKDGSGLCVRAPLIELQKHEIIRKGIELGVDYVDTTSCYDPTEIDGEGLACGRCESCVLRRQGFTRAKVPDPTRYLTR